MPKRKSVKNKPKVEKKDLPDPSTRVSGPLVDPSVRVSQ